MTTTVQKFESQPVEIFRAGTYSTNAGTKVTFDTEVMDGIVAEYNSRPEENRAPGGVNHPSQPNASPYAGTWAKSLVRNGNSISAYFTDTDTGFAQDLKDKRIKNRSAGLSLNEDKQYVLDHVAFLGMSTPRVKGMKEIEFSNEDTDIIVELENPTNLEIINNDMSKENDKTLIEFFAPMIDWFKSQAEKEDDTEGTQTEMKDKDLKAELSAAQEKIEELEAALEASNEALATLKESVELSDRKTKVEQAISEQVQAGKVTPADKEKVVEFALSLDVEKANEYIELIGAGPQIVPLDEVAASEDYTEEEITNAEDRKNKVIELTEKYEKEGLSLLAAHSKALEELQGK